MSIALFNILYVAATAFLLRDTAGEGNLRKKTGTSGMLPVLWGILLFAEMAFRGDTAVDTIRNFDSFQEGFYFDNHFFRCFAGSWNNEFGFRFLGYLIKTYCNSYLLFSCITSLIIAVSYVLFIQRYAPCRWMAMLVLLCSGSFYAGFNLHKQIIAAALFALCYDIVKQGRWFAYIVCILGISMFHFSAVVLLPMYFLLRFRMKNPRKLLFWVPLFLALIYLLTPAINALVGSRLYPEYMEEDAYRMGEGAPVLTLVKLIALPLCVLLNQHTLDPDNDDDRLCINGCILFLTFSVAASRIFMLQRFTNYFVPFVMKGYGAVLAGCSGQTRRRKAVGMCALLIASNINPIISYDYYFLWDNQFRDFLH